MTVPQPTATHLAYLAGVIDGEGHFATSLSGHGLVCCMADLAVLDWLHEHFSGSLSNAYVPPGNVRPRKIWSLNRQADLHYLLPRLLPYLVLKRRECEAMIALNSHHLANRGRAASSEFVEGRDSLRMAVRAAIQERKSSG